MKLLTLNEVAEKVGVTRQTVRNWTDKGILPIIRVSGNFYVNEAALQILDTPMREIEMARKLMEKERDEYIKEKDSYRKMRHDVEFEKDRDKYTNIAINRCVHTYFFNVVVRLLMAYNEITERDGHIILRFLYGDDFLSVGEEYHMNRERIRQIVENAFRKSRSIFKLQDRIEKVNNVERDNKILKAENSALRNRIAALTPDDKIKNMSEEEKERWQSERKRLSEILVTNIEECNFSTRTHKALVCYKVNGLICPIKTVADLCKTDSNTFLSQRGVGLGCLTEVQDFLNTYGLQLGMDFNRLCRKYLIEL